MALLLVPSWASYFLFERDKFDTAHPLFFHIPDLTRDPLGVIANVR
ncbi:MAG TPA: hypothetical protein VM489_04090 [Burkholderiales bacterium]|nr:hypothetical protein [Burkholderiales bacterium]